MTVKKCQLVVTAYGASENVHQGWRRDDHSIDSKLFFSVPESGEQPCAVRYSRRLDG